MAQLSGVELLLLIVGAALALGYGVLTVRAVSLPRSLIKTGATLALVALAFHAGAPGVITAALVFGAIGDWFLSRDARGFLPGLAAFALGHGFYFVWALGHAEPVLGLDALVLGLVLLLIAGMLLARLWPVLGELRGPVAFYVALSVALGGAALALPVGFGIVQVGIFAFLASDVILALRLFLMPDAHPLHNLAARSLWALYWGGQAAILIGALP